jgi:hypothetical protein
VDNWSVALDLQILWRTWRAMARGTAPPDLAVGTQCPSRWGFPLECERGHPWTPDSVMVTWIPCKCPSAMATYTDGMPGHLAVYCRMPCCRSVWYGSRHEPEGRAESPDQPTV